MIRAFFALDVDAALVDAASSAAESLRAILPRARWTRRDLLHVTTRFLGDTDEALVPALCEGAVAIGARRGSRGGGGLEVRATSLVAFPDARRARVLALSLSDPSGALGAIAEDCEALAVSLGFEPEARAFHAHLTLARMREATDVRAHLEELSAVGLVTALTLYRSELGEGPDGSPLYAPLARAPL